MIKSVLFTTVAFIASLVIVSSCSDYGKEKNFDNIQIFYTEGITEAEVDACGKYLQETNKDDGQTKTIQLNKAGETYQFRMVVKEGLEKEQEYIDLGPLYATELSNNVFNKKPVEVHYCDNMLKTLAVFKMADADFTKL